MIKIKPAKKINIVKTYDSKLKGKEVSVIMCKRGSMFGVLVTRGDIVMTPDYRDNKNASLTTFVGNEEEVIDWVSFEEADVRYMNLLRKYAMCQTQVAEPRKIEVPNLRLVS